MDLLELMVEVDILYHLALKNMMPFAIELDILLVKKRGITYVFTHDYAKIKIYLHDLCLQKKRWLFIVL